MLVLDLVQVRTKERNSLEAGLRLTAVQEWVDSLSGPIASIYLLISSQLTRIIREGLMRLA